MKSQAFTQSTPNALSYAPFSHQSTDPVADPILHGINVLISSLLPSECSCLEQSLGMCPYDLAVSRRRTFQTVGSPIFSGLIQEDVLKRTGLNFSD